MGLSQDSSVNQKYVWGVLEVEIITFEWMSTGRQEENMMFSIPPCESYWLKVSETLNPL